MLVNVKNVCFNTVLMLWLGYGAKCHLVRVRKTSHFGDGAVNRQLSAGNRPTVSLKTSSGFTLANAKNTDHDHLLGQPCHLYLHHRPFQWSM